MPYVHQFTAFERLTGKNNHQPQHTLVTTGTGSGKPECFLHPMLDDCFRRIGTKGTKAVVLYPMNALAAEQTRCPAKETWNNSRLKGRVIAVLYLGGDADHKVMGPNHLITDRKTLRRHPLDIQLTNYKMLDFLMFRTEDGQLWKDTGPESVRYIVLDELHTCEGAQGSDVACLLRRRQSKLNLKPGRYSCVGTTLAGYEGSPLLYVYVKRW